MPSGLDLGSGYTLRLTVLDPTTGSLVTGVKVGTVVITTEALTAGDGGDLATGQWFLVPGPNA